jgi:diguanylate cyclase (GGDEF)-like protein
VREHLRNVFAKRQDPYAGVDMANASRFGGALWFVGAFITAVLLPLIPPDDPIGDAGWAVAIAVMGAGLIVGVRMRKVGSKVNPDEMLVYSYAAIASIAILVWLSGGLDSPYAQLFLLSALYTCAAHPARRVLPYLGAFTVVVLLPLMYDAVVTQRATVELVTELAVWLSLSLAVMFLMHNVRAQRLGLRREGEQARRLARADQLTGLLNRRAFDDDLAHAIEHARATAEPLSVVVCDLDGFKDFNDRFGHLEGDRVLKAVAERLRAALRRPDVAYRWGGDEFAVILPQANARGAELVAERVEALIRRGSGPDGGALGITCGVAEYDHESRGGAAELLAAADEALMGAKGSGAFEVPQTRR